MIVMNCPSCAAEGRIPNHKINTPLVCKKCLKTFHIKPSGRAVLGLPSISGANAPHDGAHHREIDHSQDVDQWFEKLNRSFHKLARIAAALAVVFALYSTYRWFQPLSLVDQAVVTATALVRNDLTTIRELAIKGTSDEAVEWFDSVHPEFKDLIRQSPSVITTTEVLSTTRDPKSGTMDILARITLAEPAGRTGLAVHETSMAVVSGQSIEVPFVLSGSRWAGWRLDGKRTIEAFRKEVEKGLANAARP